MAGHWGGCVGGCRSSVCPLLLEAHLYLLPPLISTPPASQGVRLGGLGVWSRKAHLWGGWALDRPTGAGGETQPEAPPAPLSPGCHPNSFPHCFLLTVKNCDLFLFCSYRQKRMNLPK